MRPSIKIKIIVLVSTILFTSFSIAQTFKLDTSESKLTVYGTSSLHDWHIVSESYNGVLSFVSLEEVKLENLHIEILAESLKSGKKSMDKNTYKALQTDKYPKITFVLTQVKNIEALEENKYVAETLGDLSISGTKKNISLKFEVEIIGNTVKIKGEKAFKMTNFNVDPPTALFGTITTGNEITIKFESIFK
ncbi:YceI family protein [Aestuariivivens marinum]|uniref:YceI family protein n=1 Tax=Aestuariivivens marinum TaxID=2913555 RepID=UPI001F56EE07|nr:YceI family protein [Aestuariivivens marinum]